MASGAAHPAQQRRRRVAPRAGYFQLRSQPGAWKIKLASNTRSEELYETVQVEPVGFARSWYGPSFDADAPASDGVDIVVADFEASAHQLRVRKRKGQENVELLGEDDAAGSWFSLSSKKKKKKKSKDTIHVFSLATGSLYERMLKIMEQLSQDGESGRYTPFEALFTLEEGRAGVVVTFMAILELAKEAMIEIVQNAPLSPIHVRARQAALVDGEEGAFERLEEGQGDAASAFEESAFEPDEESR